MNSLKLQEIIDELNNLSTIVAVDRLLLLALINNSSNLPELKRFFLDAVESIRLACVDNAFDNEGNLDALRNEMARITTSRDYWLTMLDALIGKQNASKDE